MHIPRLTILSSFTIFLFLYCVSISANAVTLINDNELLYPRVNELNNNITPYSNPYSSKRRPSRPFPRINILEANDKYHLEANMPGFRPDEIDLKIKDNYLVISGERKPISVKSLNQYRQIEMGSGYFARAITVPRDIDENKITAELKDGKLLIDIGKNRNIQTIKERKIYIK